MTIAATIDRAAICRDAWGLAREAAARAGEAVRLYIGNAMRMAWARFRIRPVAEKPKTPVEILREQIAATDEAASGLQDSISRASLDGRVALVTLMKQSLGTLEDQSARLRSDLAEISPVLWQATPCQQQQAKATAAILTPADALKAKCARLEAKKNARDSERQYAYDLWMARRKERIAAVKGKGDADPIDCWANEEEAERDYEEVAEAYSAARTAYLDACAELVAEQMEESRGQA